MQIYSGLEMITEIQQAQLDAFDEVLASLPPDKGWLVRLGQTARVIPAQFRNSRLLEEAGYNAKGMNVVEMKRADFVRLGIVSDGNDVTLDGVKMRVADINDDPTDAIVNVPLKNRN